MGFYSKYVMAAALLAFVPSIGAHAADGVDARYLTVKSMKIRELSPTGETLSLTETPLTDDGAADGGDAMGAIDEAQVALDKIINMGKEVWNIIASNKPVVNVQTDTANALPQGVRDWQSLAGWQAPDARLFEVSYENLYGMTVVDFTFRVIYTYGGNVNGKGRYLTAVTIAPANLDVSWGYTFNAHATVPSVTNAGTTAEPVAAMQLQMQWSVDTILKHSESTSAFYVRGDGQFTDLSNGN